MLRLFRICLRTSLRGYSGNDSCRMMRRHRKWQLPGQQVELSDNIVISLIDHLTVWFLRRAPHRETNRASLNKLTRLPTADLDIFQTTPVSPTFRMPCSLDCSTSKLSDRFEEPIGLSNQVAAFRTSIQKFLLNTAFHIPDSWIWCHHDDVCGN